jgi:prepilin-type processing-associated H-X9-DG protein
MDRTPQTTISAPLSGWAVASLVLGLLSLVLFIVSGLPALFLGLRTLRTINESDGRLRGRRLAIAGMVLGGFGTLATLVGLAWLILLQLQSTANRVACADHLRQLGVAIHEYQMQTKRFPRGTVANDRLPAEERLSWLVTLLPYSMADTPGRKSLFDQIDKPTAWNAEVNRKAIETPVRFYVCPALPGARSHQGPARTSYPGIAGVGRHVAELPKEQNGTLTPHIGVFGYDRQVGPEDLARGLSYTLLVAETALADGPWAAGGPPTVRGLDPTELPYLGPSRQFGGLHANGLNVLLADGSVPFIRDSMDSRQWETMATIADQ